MYILQILAALIIVLNIFFSFFIIFFERKEPTTTWAWLLIMVLLPGIGIVLYLILGQNFSRERLFKEKKVIDRNKRLEISKTWKGKSAGHRGNNEYLDLRRMNFNNSGSKYTVGNDIKIFYNGVDKFESLIDDLKRAKKFIHMEYYIFKREGKHSIGAKILKILEQKAKEGVEVRLLVDSMGSYRITKRSLKKFIKYGGKFEIFFPGILPHINTRINYRNHRKIVVIDGEYGYTGGFNVGEEYINKDEEIGFWRDTHVRINGEAVNDLNDRFLLDWCYASGEEIDNFEKYHRKKLYYPGDVGIQIVTSGPDHNEEYIKNAYIKMINNAKKNVYLETPYFVPDEPVLQALRISALSGVDVRIIIPEKPDHIFMKWAAGSYISDLLNVGAKVYAYKKGFIHSKTIVVDGLVSSIGTANLDIRSFRLNFEVNAFIFDDRVAKNMENQFFKDIEDSKHITQEEHENRGIRTRIKESIVRLISPIL